MTSGSENVEDRVRRRLQEVMVSAGVRERAVAIEVNWWLPREFIDAYQVLFEMALKLGDSAGEGAAGMGSGGGPAGKAAGRRGKKMKPGGIGSARGAASGGKRYKDTWVVKNEDALEVKRRVDAKLVDIVQRMSRQVKMERRDERAGAVQVNVGGGEGGQGKIWERNLRLHRRNSNLVELSQGGTPGSGLLVYGGLREGELVDLDGVRKKCRDCGKIAAGAWVRCPYPHS